MPEEVQDIPVIHEQFAQNLTPPQFLETDVQRLHKAEATLIVQPEKVWDEISEKVPEYMGNLKRKFPDLPEAHVEAVGDLFFGPLRLTKEELGRIKEDQYVKETSARIQHNLVHSVLYAQNPNASPEFVNVVYTSVAIQESLARARAAKQGEVRSFWNGVKAEIGIARAFLARDYRVFLPDYTQDPLDVEDEENEVLQWDVRCGVDFVAIKDGEFFLIDAKGRYGEHTYNGYGNREKMRDVSVEAARPISRFPKAMAEFVEPFHQGRVHNLTVFVPTALEYLQRLESGLVTVESKRTALARFSVSSFQREIVDDAEDLVDLETVQRIRSLVPQR